jgi:hypothetical protein
LALDSVQVSSNLIEFGKEELPIVIRQAYRRRDGRTTISASTVVRPDRYGTEKMAIG